MPDVNNIRVRLKNGETGTIFRCFFYSSGVEINVRMNDGVVLYYILQDIDSVLPDA